MFLGSVDIISRAMVSSIILSSRLAVEGYTRRKQALYPHNPVYHYQRVVVERLNFFISNGFT